MRRLILLALLVAAAGRFVAFEVSEYLAPHAAGVDFNVYYGAAQALAHGGRLYANPPPCCFSAEAMYLRYTYPPLFAVLLAPLTAFSVDDAGRIMLIAGTVALLVILLVGWRAAPQRVSWETLGWVALLLVCGPVFAALYAMQATPLVVALEAVFAYSVVRDRWLVAGGVCLAVAASIKLTPLLLIPSLLLLPRPSALRALAGIGAGLTVAGSVIVLAPQQALFYITRVLPSFSGGVISPWNRSLPGVVLRALEAGGVHPGPVLGALFLAIEVIALGATIAVCWRVRGRNGRALMIAAILAVIPIVQGVTWDQHLVVELLVLVLLAPLLRFGSLPWALTIVGVALVTIPQSLTVDLWLRHAGMEPPHHPLAFVLFVAAAAINLFGMVAVWLAVAVTAHRMRSAEPSTARTTSMLPQMAGA